ncbi:N-acyl-phosphatidylethanolamine-hydrolyzing phospholipase D-like [Octopus sinensis]|uniref:N-acyl-phosphatidylethanolamine-hydrolyzing phospholipase D-like n=1 Tax=Octopus sinensis TaxID=2607531 RepID=A0A7E6EIT4_9MOLL|nr:N-acyl-phosphatidylethanolamine-hydrolyzing phospholipase D-like [Octopus sinensis]
MDNLNILTDPIVSDIVLCKYIFLPRVNQNAISIPELPEIDYVLISHSHHDHLDYPAFTQLHQRFPKIKFLVPLNVKALILSPIFKTIGMKYGPFDVAALPIGAYAPKFLFKYQHADPRECILIQQDVQAKHCIGVHWGTFRLGYEVV